MKLSSLARAFSGATIASLSLISAVVISHQPSYAGGATFYCGTSTYRNKSVPTTFARTQDGKRVPIVRWISNYFPPSPGIGCTSDTVLITLKPCSKPQATIRRLLDRRGLAGGMVLNESANSVDIDFEMYLRNGSDEARDR